MRGGTTNNSALSNMGAAWQGDKNKSAAFCTCVVKKEKNIGAVHTGGGELRSRVPSH